MKHNIFESATNKILKETFEQSLRMFTDDFMAEGRPPQIPAERETL